ncbi:MAG TPA: zf-HC2 domain-containing protein [bacterium]|nr:zf-HC2 domain-containing protein [bacterium]
MHECSGYKELIVGWLNGTLDDAGQRRLQEHFATCPSCLEELTVARSLKKTAEGLRKTPMPVPSSFDEALHLKLVTAAQEQRITKPQTWFSLFSRPVLGIIAALFVITLAATIYLSNDTTTRDEGTLISRSDVSVGGPVTIELEYEAGRDIAEATVTIELEAGISFYSTIPDISSRKTLSWSGPLKKGKNAVPFAVTVAQKGVWHIATTADYEGLRHRHRVILSADGYKVVIAQYRLRTEVLDAQKVN